VALVREQGYSVPEAAKSLGIATNMLYRWKDQYEQQLAGKLLAEDERKELKRLRKEKNTTLTNLKGFWNRPDQQRIARFRARHQRQAHD